MKLNILFDIGHPAHVHLFKNFISYLKDKKYNCIITSRDKEITNNLLAYYGIDYISITKPRSGFIGLFLEMIIRDYQIYRLYKKYRFDIGFGTSVSIAHLSIFTKFKSYNFCEDDDKVIPIQVKIIYPFTTKIINPICLKFRKWQKKRILAPSFHELAYLHPNNFIPNIDIVKKYGLLSKKYIIIRLSALKAHHDFGMHGISNLLLNKIKEILKDYTIIESHELKKDYKIAPWDMHHVLAYSKMIISDSQTMAAEAMVLGTPSIRINSFVGRISYLEELENFYKLGYGYLPHKENEIIETINYLANNKQLDEIWQQKRQIMLNDKIDFNKWIIDYFEKEIKPTKIHK